MNIEQALRNIGEVNLLIIPSEVKHRKCIKAIVPYPNTNGMPCGNSFCTMLAFAITLEQRC